MPVRGVVTELWVYPVLATGVGSQDFERGNEKPRNVLSENSYVATKYSVSNARQS